VGNAAEIKALFFALIRGSAGAEIIFLNQNLAVGSSSVLRDFNAHFLGPLTRRLFETSREIVCGWSNSRTMCSMVSARAIPTRGSRAGLSVEQMLNRVSRVFG
jgi:hypothetical protein